MLLKKKVRAREGEHDEVRSAGVPNVPSGRFEGGVQGQEGGADRTVRALPARPAPLVVQGAEERDQEIRAEERAGPKSG